MIKCPKCGKEIDEWENVCPYCKTNFNKFDRGQGEIRNHAYWLNAFAIIDLIISIIASIIVFINYSTIEITDKIGASSEIAINWIGILGGIGIFITGLTTYFLLETIVDIYDMTEENAGR